MVDESRILYFPFQVGRNFAHYEMSFFASEFREIRWDNLSTVVDKSMRRLINIRQDGITLEANESFPINESRSLFVHFSNSTISVALPRGWIACLLVTSVTLFVSLFLSPGM